MRMFPVLLLTVGALLGCQKELPKGSDTAPTPYPSGPASQAASQPHRAPGAPASASPGAPVSGTIQLAEGAEVRTTDVLYVMARRTDGAGPGALVAVTQKRNVSAETFPARFELGPGNVMMQGVPFSGPFRIYARLDRDGDPMTKTAEDLYGEVGSTVTNGTSNLVIKLAPKAPAAGSTSQPAAPSSQPASAPSH